MKSQQQASLSLPLICLIFTLPNLAVTGRVGKRIHHDLNQIDLVEKVNNLRDVSCPNPLDIQPCVCSPNVDSTIVDLDCSLVEDEAQLEAVFQSAFPSTTFRRLTIFNNNNIKVLHDGALGNISFTDIWVTEGSLEEVQDNALPSTAKRLVFNFNNITTFPFSALQSFPQLVSLDLRGNNIQALSGLASETLQVLYLSKNPLGSLLVDIFAATPAMVDLHLSKTQLTQIIPGTFAGLSSLKNLGLGDNHLSQLESGAIQCSNTVGLIDLGYNDLTSVAPGAFQGLVDGWVYIHHNRLNTLDEEVWSTVIQGPEAYLDPYGNPLVCGCDIAWLLNDSVTMEKIDVYSTCADGKLIVDLDPADFSHC